MVTLTDMFTSAYSLYFRGKKNVNLHIPTVLKLSLC